MIELMKIAHLNDVPSLTCAADEFEASLIRVALECARGHRGDTAAALGIHRNSLLRLCKKHQIALDYGLNGRAKVGRR